MPGFNIDKALAGGSIPFASSQKLRFAFLSLEETFSNHFSPANCFDSFHDLVTFLHSVPILIVNERN